MSSSKSGQKFKLLAALAPQHCQAVKEVDSPISPCSLWLFLSEVSERLAMAPAVEPSLSSISRLEVKYASLHYNKSLNLDAQIRVNHKKYVIFQIWRSLLNIE